MKKLQSIFIATCLTISLFGIIPPIYSQIDVVSECGFKNYTEGPNSPDYVIG